MANFIPTPTDDWTVHHGRAVHVFREIRGLKQASLAQMTGMGQKTISILERSEFIDLPARQKLADALQIPMSAITHYTTVDAVESLLTTFNT